MIRSQNRHNISPIAIGAILSYFFQEQAKLAGISADYDNSGYYYNPLVLPVQFYAAGKKSLSNKLAQANIALSKIGRGKSDLNSLIHITEKVLKASPSKKPFTISDIVAIVGLTKVKLKDCKVPKITKKLYSFKDWEYPSSPIDNYECICPRIRVLSSGNLRFQATSIKRTKAEDDLFKVEVDLDTTVVAVSTDFDTEADLQAFIKKQKHTIHSHVSGGGVLYVPLELNTKTNMFQEPKTKTNILALKAVLDADINNKTDTQNSTIVETFKKKLENYV